MAAARLVMASSREIWSGGKASSNKSQVIMIWVNTLFKSCAIAARRSSGSDAGAGTMAHDSSATAPASNTLLLAELVLAVIGPFRPVVTLQDSGCIQPRQGARIILAQRVRRKALS